MPFSRQADCVLSLESDSVCTPLSDFKAPLGWAALSSPKTRRRAEQQLIAAAHKDGRNGDYADDLAPSQLRTHYIMKLNNDNCMWPLT